jgi:hypothetical protein
MHTSRGLAIVFFSAMAWPVLRLPAAAQWLNYPTPGIPRTADGKPNLSAPAPRTADGKPDLTGLWRPRQSAAGETDKALREVKAQPWAAALSKKRKEEMGREDMSILCLPFGPRAAMAPDKIIQTPSMVIILFNDLTYRQVFMDGRPLPKDPNPTWMGYSIGHWDGDTLVVESAGFNERTWLDGEGHPHSEDLRVTERYRRPDFGHLELERTLEDPKALEAKWVVPIKMDLDADTEMLEYVCAENERDRSHLVGKVSDEKKIEVKVPVEILKQYVATYEFKPPEHPEDPIPIEISLDGEKLMAAMSGGAKYALTAVSETKFFFEGAHIEFVKDDSGKVSHMLIQAVEGEFKAPRK